MWRTVTKQLRDFTDMELDAICTNFLCEDCPINKLLDCGGSNKLCPIGYFNELLTVRVCDTHFHFVYMYPEQIKLRSFLLDLNLEGYRNE